MTTLVTNQKTYAENGKIYYVRLSDKENEYARIVNADSKLRKNAHFEKAEDVYNTKEGQAAMELDISDGQDGKIQVKTWNVFAKANGYQEVSPNKRKEVNIAEVMGWIKSN